MSKDDGGFYHSGNILPEHPHQPLGITRRDLSADRIAASLIANEKIMETVEKAALLYKVGVDEALARMAYSKADALIAEGKKE